MSEEREELDLLAFRYVAGELVAEEAGAFEARLADDQQAREAVSRAVGLAERLVEAAPQTPPLVTPVRRHRAQRETLLAFARPLGWMTAGAAATLLALTLDRGPPAGIEGERESRRPATSASHPPADAVVWARLHADQNWATVDLERWVDEPTSPVRETPDSTAVPSWVFATKPESEK